MGLLIYKCRDFKGIPPPDKFYKRCIPWFSRYSSQDRFWDGAGFLKLKVYLLDQNLLTKQTTTTTKHFWAILLQKVGGGAGDWPLSEGLAAPMCLVYRQTWKKRSLIFIFYHVDIFILYYLPVRIATKWWMTNHWSFFNYHVPPNELRVYTVSVQEGPN